MDDSYKGRHDMILGRDILTALGLNIKSSGHTIEAYDGPFKVSASLMVSEMATYLYGFAHLSYIVLKKTVHILRRNVRR